LGAYVVIPAASVASGNLYGSLIMLLVVLPVAAIIVIILEVIFFILAGNAITASFGETDQRKIELRNLRSLNLGMNIAGIMYMPILIWLGIPIMLSALSSHVNASTPGWRRVKGLAIAFSVVEAVHWLVVALLFILETTRVLYSSPSYNYNSVCYSCPYPYNTYAPVFYTEPAFVTYWFIWFIVFLIRESVGIAFIACTDQLNLKLIDNYVAGGQAVQMVGRTIQAPTMPVVTVSPCPTCQAPLQYSALPPPQATQVQCYKCSAIVEFSAVL